MPAEACACSSLPTNEPNGVEVIKDLVDEAYAMILREPSSDDSIVALAALNAIAYAFLIANMYPDWREEIETWLTSNACEHTWEYIKTFMEEHDWPSEEATHGTAGG